MAGPNLLRLLLPGLSLLVWFLAGCATSKQTQLEAAARDWCMTLRASQIIPVYPLTEDIQPGDLFLVQVPIDRQQEVYDAAGFLPLDNHVARLHPDSYIHFYDHSFLGTNAPLLPRDWMRPTNLPSWDPAPRAAFPSYSFSVRRGGGLNLAVPVQGVPVGLSLLGSDSASGSVTIRNARTLGVDTISLHRQLTNWARTNASFLGPYGPSATETNYLRLINRVYVTGRMDVELRDARSRSGGLEAGAARPVSLLFPELPAGVSNTAETVTHNYTNGWNLLSGLVERASDTFAAGGSLRLTAASGRTIALQEQFDPPLTLGYLGFDCAILDGGRLGPPIPTHAQLDRNARLHQARIQEFNTGIKQQIASFEAIAARYTNATADVQRFIRDRARELKLTAAGEGADWIQGLGDIVDGNDPIKTRLFLELRKRLEEVR